ncbi:MAG: PAS domain S-box protein [Desulfobacteraceae bacterium]|nr:MAG: PAS domain S-box protein [Desulfobacteraceae bacterium]
MTDQREFIKLSLEQLKRPEPPASKSKSSPTQLEIEYERILDSLDDVIFIVDKNGNILFVNKASERRTGIPSKSLIGRHYSYIIEPEYKESADRSFKKAISGKTETSLEIEFQNSSGRKITVEVAWKTLYENDIAVGVLGASRDVTDRKLAQETLKKVNDELERRVRERTQNLQKANELLQKQIDERVQAQEKLRETEQKYRGLFENSGDAVIIVDIETGKILDANPQAEQLTGLPGQELIGMHQYRLHPTEDAEHYLEKFQKHINNEMVFGIEEEVVKKDGTTVPVYISSSLINLDRKKVIQFIIKDISKEKIISDLRDELAAKILVNRAKAIIAKQRKINDRDAMRLLQQESRRQRRKLKEIAQAVISSRSILV